LGEKGLFTILSKAKSIDLTLHAFRNFFRKHHQHNVERFQSSVLGFLLFYVHIPSLDDIQYGIKDCSCFEDEQIRISNLISLLDFKP
jgi:hypothetical protein